MATASSSSQVNLTWTHNSSSETGYTFAYDTNSGLTSPTYVYAGGVNTTSYSHTGRSAATTYYYKIKAEGNPDSAWSSVDSATTAPSGLAATATSESMIHLSWTGNPNNSAIVGYTYAFATNSSFTGATYKHVADNGSSSTTRTALNTATTYWFKIKAEGTSDALDSPYGTVVTETTTPASFTATAVSGNQINLSWVGNAGNSRINGYTYAFATNSSFTGATYTYVSGAGATSTSHTGLSPGTTYYYKIKVEGTSDSYDSAFTDYVAATTTTGSIPDAPSGLSASVVSNSQINLSWTDNSTNETGFEVKRATDSAFSQNVVWIGGIQGTTYASTGLSPGTTYYYMVRAQGSEGKSAYSNPASATTGGTPPPVPSGGVPISPHCAGINAWMPDKVGSVSYGGDLMAKWNDVELSGVKIMRYGGSSVDCNADPSSTEVRAQYVSLVQAMKESGFEPVLQVAVCPRYRTSFTAPKAGDLVRYINGTMGLGVKYWSIGNEPDLGDGNYSATGYTKASQVAAYFKPFATEMKKADPTIKILGPETAWYNGPIIKGLTTCDETASYSDTDDLINLPGKDEYGRYYVDIISFHTYNGFDGTQDREQVIGKLTKYGSFNDDLSALKARIAECNRFNGRTGSEALKIAVTETNVNHQAA